MKPVTAVAPAWRWALALLPALCVPAATRADGVEGVVVAVPGSVTTESVARLKSSLVGPLKRHEAGPAKAGGRFVVVCDFNPEGRRADSDNFGACLELADYLRSLPFKVRNATAVAYVRGDVVRHSVLPALACGEIVFSSQGKLGRIVEDGPGLGRVELTAYDEMVKGRRPPALVRRMYDPTLDIFQVGDDFKASDDKPRPQGDPIIPADGSPLLYDFRLASRVGLCAPVAVNSLEALRAKYGITTTSSTRRPDRVACWRIPIEGELNGEAVELTKRRVRRALEARANMLIFEIKCAGGDSEQAAELGNYIASLNDGRQADKHVETIAYVTNKARNTAAFVAFACHKIVMQSEEGDGREEDDDLPASEARLGGFGLYLQRHASLGDARRADEGKGRPELEAARSALETNIRKNLADIAAKQLHPAILAEAMASQSLKVHLVRPAKGAKTGRMFMSDDDYREDQAKGREWISEKMVKPWENLPPYKDRYLTLSAKQARDIGVAEVVRNVEELYEREGLSPGQVNTPRSEWIDGLAEFLRSPVVSVLLVMVGIVCLILELKMPGIGLPGVLAAICFVLFFWAHSQLSGQITWLAILLFLLGLVLIGLEVFVLPGLGVCGISGVLLVLSGLGLIAFGYWPRDMSDWIAFGDKLWPFGVSLLGSLVLAAVFAKYLPQIPVLNRLLPPPPEEEEDAREMEHPGHAERLALLGAIGVTATPLRPAGKTKFGDDYVDVVAEGGYIMPGARVQVVEIEGNRVVVKQV